MAKGRIRGHAFGEGDYDKSEIIIQKLLAEAGFAGVPTGIVNPQSAGAMAAADIDDLQSPETYLGYAKMENFMSVPVKDKPAVYMPAPLPYGRNQWGLTGTWTIGEESAVLDKAPGGILFRFHARDLHLVLGSAGKPVRFRVTLDGKAAGRAHAWRRHRCGGQWQRHPAAALPADTPERRHRRPYIRDQGSSIPVSKHSPFTFG